MRAALSSTQEPRKARLTSERKERCATASPNAANHPSSAALCPHWLGEHHACGVSSIANTSPRLVGLKRCLPRTRRTNLLEMATAAAKGPTQKASVRSSSDSPSEVTSGERYPTGGARNRRV